MPRSAWSDVVNKYGARRTFDPILQEWFDSKAEANHAQELSLLQKAGEIHSLVFHPRWVLSDRKGMKVKYEADFGYITKEGQQMYEDVKGRETEASRVKRAWLMDKLGIEVVVVWV